MKKLIFIALSLTSLAAAADIAPKNFLAENRRVLPAGCQDDIARAEIEKDLESAAYQQCQSDLEELGFHRPLDVFNQIKLCDPDKPSGGLIIDQRLFECSTRMNPNALFPGGTSMLQGGQSRDLGLIYFHGCLQMRVIGASSQDIGIGAQLNNLAKYLSVSVKESELQPKLVRAGRDSYLQYDVDSESGRSTNVRFKSRNFRMTINDLVQRLIGPSPTTGFARGVQLQIAECQ